MVFCVISLHSPNLESKHWFLILCLKRILTLQWASTTADLRSVFSSVLPKPLISWWILVVHCLMQNEKISPDSQSKVCWKNMGRKQVYVSPWEREKTAYFQLISLLKLSYSPESWRLQLTHAGRQKASEECCSNLATSIPLNNSVTKWLMTHWQDQVPQSLDYSRH